jgi:hypothetical protein
MKVERHGWLGARGDLDEPREYSPERLRPPEIVGEVRNPVLEAIRRCWWRAFDRVCDYVILIRLSINDRIFFGPEPPPSADLSREAD